MAVIQDKVQIGSSSDFLDGVSVDTPAGTDLFRETVVTADPEFGDALARVRATEPAADDFGAVTRVIGLNDKLDQLIAKPPIAQDIFGHVPTSQRTNQIEVPLNDSNWAQFVTIDAQHGTASQANGQVTFQTGTNPAGYYGAASIDNVKYRAASEIGWGFTCSFPDAGTATSYQRIGATDGLAWQNGVWLGYEGASFGLTYYRSGVQVFHRPVAEWLNMGGYTKDGAAVAFDKTKDQLVRIRAGLFGHRGFIAEIMTPDGNWLTIADYNGINSDSVPAFAEFDLRVGVEVFKSAGAENLRIRSACWAGWTGQNVVRVSDTISDRTLAQVTRTIIEGKTTSGGGGYVPVKVSPSGTLAVGNTSVGPTGSPVPAEATYVAVNDGSGTLVPLVQPTTPADTQPVSASALPLPSGAATEAKQLPDNHQVQVSNLPSEYPLPAAQVTALTPQTDALTEAQLRTVVPDEAGVWSYYAGAAGSVSVAGRVLQITATAGLVAGSLTINGGATVSVPAGKSITIEPRANLSSPTVVFTSTQAYFIEVVA